MTSSLRRLIAPTAFTLGATSLTYTTTALVDRDRRAALTTSAPRRERLSQRVLRWWGIATSPTAAVTTATGALWRRISPNERFVWGLVGVNAAVFVAMRVPGLRSTMWRHFAHDTDSGRVTTLATSMFAHSGVVHLAFNMIALSSFGPTLVGALGREQFLAMYLSSGLIAAYTSHALRVLLRQPAICIGASGALYGTLVVYASLFPQAQVSLIFLPTVPISITTAVAGLIAFDISGAFLRLTNMDHLGHLGGALGGLLHLYVGRGLWARRDELLGSLQPKRA